MLNQQFANDLAKEDDLGMVLRGHLHVEHQLKEFISLFLPFSERCNWQKLGYAQKIELALSCGLPADMRTPLEKIGSLRNSFAHKLNMVIQKKAALDMFECLSTRHKDAVNLCYIELGRDEELSLANVDTKELLQIIIVSIHSAIQAAILEKLKIS